MTREMPEKRGEKHPQRAGVERALVTRRAAILTAALGAAGSASGASWWSWLSRAADSEKPADTFPGDAPKGPLWDQWQARGWVKEAAHYLKLGENVQCKVCPNNCLLKPGDRSHCRNKVNQGGTLYTMAYGNPCTFHVDPIEKKPLFHFLPGSKSFSLATSGCVFRCLNCQNWEISQKKPEETKDASGPELRLRPPLPSALSLGDVGRLSLFPVDLAQIAQALDCPSVSYTYSEPTAYYEYARDCCMAVRAQRRRNVLVTCGSIEERPLRELLQYVDAAHVDLKGFDDAVYQKLNSGRLQPVLSTLKLYRSLGVWFEVINLVVPSYTDNFDSIRRMCDWMVQNLGADTPLHFSRFTPLHKLTHLSPTPINTLLQARETARAAGLRYVYLGNVRGVADAETTFCPGCKRAIVERTIFSVTRCDVVGGKCRFCQVSIPGVWKAQV